ncbi:hypothetical protein [Engelhardtia mirabilis]
MRLKPLLFVAVPIAATPALASESVDIRAVHRNNFATGSGVQAGDQSERDGFDQLVPSWGSSLVVDLDDRLGADVVDSWSNFSTLLGPDGFGAVVDARSKTARGQRGATGTAGAEYRVDFDVRDTVRFVFAADVRSTRGDSGAAARIRRGDALHLEVVTRSGGQEHARRYGWLQPGAFQFEGHALVVAKGQGARVDQEGASANFSLRFLDAADTDLDGDVDREDLVLFARLIGAGSRFADFDGDGRVGQLDARGYMGAYVAAQTELRPGARETAGRERRPVTAERDELRRGTEHRVEERATRHRTEVRPTTTERAARQRDAGELRARRRGR